MVQSVQKEKEMTRDQGEMIENLFSKLSWTTYQWKAKDEKLLTEEDRLPDGVKKFSPKAYRLAQNSVVKL